NVRWRAEAAAIALRVAQGDESAAKNMAARHLAELLSIAPEPDANRQAIEELLYGAAWAARLGLVEDARKALAIAGRYGALERFPVRAGLAAVAQAAVELGICHGDKVRPLLQAGAALCAMRECHNDRER